MLGAIVGDVVGSVFEFRNTKDYHFRLLSERSNYTDDSVMSFAVAKWLLDDHEHSYQGLEDAMVVAAEKYPCPMGGYGGGFKTWLFQPKGLYDYVDQHGPLPYRSVTGRHPYGSWGNGSAMRVGAIGWFFDTLEETERVAEISAAITHNHPDGITGAKATAAAIWMARNGKSKEEIRSYIEQRYRYFLHDTYTYWHSVYGWDSSCRGTVPQAIICVLDSTGFEDAIRKAVSLGGDSDTLACITGGIAEAFYGGVPHVIADAVINLLPDEFVEILKSIWTETSYWAVTIDCMRFFQSASYKKRQTQKALLLWKSGLGDSNRRFFGGDITPRKVEKVTVEQLCVKPMADNPIEVSLNFELDEQQMEIISYGHISETMEDHWSMYCDEEWIRYYRSWTGMCVFEAKYEKREKGFLITTLRINPGTDRSERFINANKALFLALLMDECGGDSEWYWNAYLNRMI